MQPLKICGQLHLGRSDALEIVGRHGHGWSQERGLKVQRHQDAEEQRVDAEMRQQRQEDRHEDDDDLRPLQRPAQQEDDDLGHDQEGERRDVEPAHEIADHLVAAEIGEYRREGPGADEEPADHRRGLHGQIDRLAQPLPGQRPVGRGKAETAKRADRGRLRRRGEAEEDCSEYREDQDGERHERRRKQDHQTPEGDLLHVLGPRLRGDFGVESSPGR